MVTTSRALKMLYNVPSLALDSSTAIALPDVGFRLVGQSVPPPVAPVPLQALQFSIPTEGTPEAQYQHLLGLVQHLQDMALSLCPLMALEAPFVPPFQFQAFPTTPPP